MSSFAISQSILRRLTHQTRRECTDLLPAKGGIGPSKSALFPDMQHQPGALYYGYITPFVNMTISGWLWCRLSYLHRSCSTAIYSFLCY